MRSVARAQETDAAEDARLGESHRGDEQPEELRRRKDRLAAIQAAKASAGGACREADDARGPFRNPKGGLVPPTYGEPKPSADNFTDPESRIMKTSAGSSATTRRWRWRGRASWWSPRT